MPLPAKPLRLCVFGDSHIGCIKQAVTAGMVKDSKKVDVEFWGADGPQFRGLDLVDQTLVPRRGAKAKVELVNGRGRAVLDPKDFDAVLFVGVRIRTFEFFAPNLHLLGQPDGFLSDAVLFRACQGWLTRHRFYRAAKAFAESQSAQIFLTPCSFPTEGFRALQTAGFDLAAKATKKTRDRFWHHLTGIAAKDGITLIPQPEKSVVGGCTTGAAFAIEDAVKLNDPVHRNPVYGAEILQAALDIALKGAKSRKSAASDPKAHAKPAQPAEVSLG